MYRNVDFTIKQGQTFSKGWIWEDGSVSPAVPYDLTGCTARAEVRPRADSPDLIVAFSTSPAAGEGTIVLGGTAGTIDLSLTAAQTALLTRGGPYDLFITFADGTRTPVFEGEVTLEWSSTHGP